MNYLKLVFSFGILSNCIAYDQATKHLARTKVLSSLGTAHVSRIIEYRYVENPYGFIDPTGGLPNDFRAIFFGAVLIVLFLALIELIFLSKKLPTMMVGGLCLIAGGGLSNLIDRLLNDGRVVDFIALKLFLGHSFILNLADLAIFAGVLMLLFHPLRRSTRTSTMRTF